MCNVDVCLGCKLNVSIMDEFRELSQQRKKPQNRADIRVVESGLDVRKIPFVVRICQCCVDIVVVPRII